MLSSSTNKWRTPQPVEKSDELPKELSRPIKELLIRRGILDMESHKSSYNITSLPDPKEHFKDLDRACERILLALNNKQKIAICGDYDADGMTSTALLCDYFTKINGNPIPFIPSREEEGYGLNTSIVEKIHKEGINLIITVDNGVSAIEALNKANLLGIDVILTDHHQIKDSLPNIFALIHPFYTPSNSPYKYLAGVGVAYLLALAIAKKTSSEQYLNLAKDLFCIGTVADMAQLKGANRYWLRQWIKQLPNTESLGLRTLLKKSRLNTNSISTDDISFKIAPRINSVGRISDPKIVLKMFLETDQKEVKKLVNLCERINIERKNICKQVTAEAFQIIEKESNNLQPFIFLAQPHWPPGIIGIIAARVMEKYNRPTAVLCPESSGFLRASIRSPSNFNVVKALENCESLLEKYGGHAAAGGFTIKATKLAQLHKRLNNLCICDQSNLNVKLTFPEAYIEFQDINQYLFDNLETLGPFGQGNKRPLFWTRCCHIIKKQSLFNGLTKLTLKQREKIAEATFWGDQIPQIKAKTIDIAFYIDYEQYSDTECLQLTLDSFKEYKSKESFLFNNRIYSCYLQNNDEVIIENVKGKKIVYNTKGNNCHEYCDYISKLIYTSTSILGVVN